MTRELAVVLTEPLEGGHGLTADLAKSPPEGVRYVLKPMHWNAPVWDHPLENALRWKLHGLRTRLLGPPVPLRPPRWRMPIHCSQALLETSDPWMSPLEHPGAWVAFDYDRLWRPSARRRLLGVLGAESCRFIAPWTEHAARGVRAYFPELADKVRVVHPAVRVRERAAAPDPERPLVLFVARRFHYKGGAEALEAFARVRRERVPGARMLMVADTPEAVKAKYAKEGVEFLQAPQPREVVFARGFSQASVFMMPTRGDSFGAVFLEAFAHGVPVITTETFAGHEIVDHGRDGLVVPGYRARWWREDGTHDPRYTSWDTLLPAVEAEDREPVVRALAEALGEVLADPARQRRMGEAALEKMRTGPFSVPERNRRLRAMYEEMAHG